MIDFDKLMDPEEQKKAKARREADEAARAEKDLKMRDKIDLCHDNEHMLSQPEASFVRSIRHATLTHRVLSDKQEKYLNDIHKRLEKAPVVVCITQGLRGHFAVLMQVEGDEAGPINSGIGSYRTAGGAYSEAHDWAVSEGVPIFVNRRLLNAKEEPKPQQAAKPDETAATVVEAVDSGEPENKEAPQSGAKRMKLGFRR
jgi:hypothetical protein